jgi:hypothetical protein
MAPSTAAAVSVTDQNAILTDEVEAEVAMDPAQDTSTD